MLMTSKFTLYFNYSSPDYIITPSIQRLPMPAQLSFLNVKESEWAKLYDYAIGVVEREVQRIKASKQLDDYVKANTVQVFNSKKVDKAREEAKVKKAEYARDTKKGWNVLLQKCTTLERYGISSHHMVDTKFREYGIEFICTKVTNIKANKLILAYDNRREMWSFQRDSVPDELAALHVKEESWMKVWNYADSTIKKVMLLEAEKKKLQQKMNSPEVDISGFSTNNMDVAPGLYKAMRTAALLSDEKHKIRYKQELEWTNLLDYAMDELFAWNINAQLYRSPSALEISYSGLVLRFLQPVVATATASATIVS